MPLRILILNAALLAAASFARAETPETDGRLETPGQYARYELKLPGAMPEGKDLVLHLGMHDGRALQAWGDVPGNQQIPAVFDNELLALDGDRLAGRLRLWLKLDEFPQTYVCLVDLDARVDGAKIGGRYGTRYSVLTDTLVYTHDDLTVEPGEASLFHYGQELTGKATCRMLAHAAPGQARLTLWSRHLMEGQSSWQRYVDLEAEVRDGKVVELKIVPSHGAAAEWTATNVRSDLTFDGEKLTGTVTFDTEGSGGTSGGTYRFTVDAAVEHNIVKGIVRATRDGKAYTHETQLSGVADSGPAETRANAVFTLDLAKAVEGKRDLRIHLDRRGGRIVAARAFVPAYPEWFDVVVAEGGGDGQAFAGRLTVKFPENTNMISRAQALNATYALDMQGSPGASAGTYRCEFGEYSRAEGELAGAVVDPEALARREAIRNGHDWPCWNGPRSSFAAKAAGHALVERLSDARLVWKSENTFPARCQTTRYGESNVRRWIEAGGGAGSGGNSPVLSGGRVFLSYFQPVPGPTDEKYVASEVAKGNHVMPIMFAENGVDVALCIDAATGRTLWRRTIPGGRYFAMDGRQGSTKGWYTTNLAAEGERVYFGTSTDVDYCLDAATGAVVWKRQLGPTGGRIVVGDVLLRMGADVVGYDAATGETRWTVEKAGATYALPLGWVHGGKEYAIAGNTAGEVRCIDPADGRVLWTVTGTGTQAYTMCVEGDYLLLSATSGDDERGSLGCYRLSLDGAERLWVLDAQKYPYTPSHAPACAADGHAFIRLKRPDGLAVIELKTGKVAAALPQDLGASGYVEWMDGRAVLQSDASHGPTPLLWYDVAKPAAARQLGDIWPTRHRTTASYYPILISHALADGRIFIRGARGIYCYDLRK